MILDLEPKHKCSRSQRGSDKMNGGSSSFSNGRSRRRSQRLLLLVLALGMATVSVMLFHKLREGRIFGLLLQDQDRQIVTLQLLLQRERENTKEIKRKLENMRARNFILSTQKMELANKLTETQTAADHLQRMQSEMETSLEEKQNEIKGLADKAEESVRANLQVADITELLKQKETEVEEMKEQLKKLGTSENNTVSRASEGTDSSNGNEVKSEENENTPKEGRWVKVQTNVDDESSKAGDGEASDGHENTSEVKEQSKELNGEGKADNKADTETSQESTTEVQEQSKESRNEQEMSDNLEKKELGAAQDGEEGKPADSQYGTRKVKQNKNRGKGRRRRKSNNSVKKDNRYGAKESNELEGEQKKTTRETPKLETPEGSQVDGSSNSEGQSNSQTMTEAREEKTVSSNQQLENAQNQEDGQGDSANGNVEGEEREKEQSEKSENPVDDEAKNENGNDKAGAATELGTEKESDAEKQDEVVVKEEADFNTTSIAKLTDDDNAAAEDGKGSKFHEGNNTDKIVDGAEKAVEAESQKSENPREDEAKNENSGEETGASANLKTEKESDAAKQEEVVKEEADVNMTSVTEQRDTDNGADHQTEVSEDSNNTNDSSSISENKDEDDTKLKGNVQNDNGQDTA